MATSSAPARLQMHNVHKRFGATVALAGVDLEVHQGQVLAMVGENGAGKSTLMKVLSGAHRADDGRMWLDGQPYAPSGPLEARRAGVAMIYQELSLAPHLSVMENILLGVEPRVAGLVRWRRVRETARQALLDMGRDDIPLDAPAGSLSVGRQQLVEIARAVAVGARVLVLDEPTSSLAAADIVRLFELVRRLKARGYAIIYISHFLEEVTTISDRFTVLRDGRTVGGGATADITHDQIIRLMVGRDVSDLYPRTARTPGEVVLQLHSLAGRVKPQAATLALRRGEVLGVAGLVGAGRTELLRAVFGLDPVCSGRLKVHLHEGPASPARRWRQGVGLVSEDRKSEGLALSLSVADNLTLSYLRPAGRAGLLWPRRQRRLAEHWASRLRVKCSSTSQAVGDLSGGNQQKVALARLLHHDCDVLLLDEPTRGIDVSSKAEIYHLIDDLARQGKAILMVSSYLPELLGVCDRVAVMHRGRLGAARSVADTSEDQIMAEATGAVAAASEATA